MIIYSRKNLEKEINFLYKELREAKEELKEAKEELKGTKKELEWFKEALQKECKHEFGEVVSKMTGYAEETFFKECKKCRKCIVVKIKHYPHPYA